ncbi:MAG: hemolysin family protein [Myxococcaceae bacterium]|nr:hemolysin family protein [Myxococcaceae bacterium]
MSIWLELGLLLALTLVTGVFTGAEIAMLSVRRTRLEELANAGHASAKAALRLRKTPEALLATIQVGVTVLGATAAAFGGARLEGPLAEVFSRLGLGEASGPLAFAVVVGGVSYLSLVVGELVPKSLALRAPERFALLVAAPLSFLSTIARPLVWLLTTSSNLVLRPFGDRTTFSESRLSPDELQQLVEESGTAGALHPCSADIASRAIDLGRLKASALMVPRPRIVALERSAPADEVRALLRQTPHARYPVYEGTIDTVRGYVVAREVSEALLEGRFSLEALVRPMAFVPASKLALDVLRQLQASKQQVALLVDEHGGTEGLVTVEDIAEELLGEILEETEVLRVTAWRAADGALWALGEAPLHEVERLAGVPLPAEGALTTVAGLLTHQLQRLPVVGDRVALSPRVDAEVRASAEGGWQAQLMVRSPGD